MKRDPDQVAIEEAAIAWLLERDEGLSPARACELDRWLRADPRHASSFSRIEQTHRLLQTMPDHRAAINTTFERAAPVVLFPGVEGKGGGDRGIRRWAIGLVWGGVAVAVAFGGFAAWQFLRPATDISYATTAAGYERARLDDGSTLELNAATELTVRFTAAERRVKIETGEAHFAVAHDEARPFIVSAGDVSMRAVGTAFNVRLTAESVEVIVIEGKVRVGPDNHSRNGAVLLMSGQRMQIPTQTAPPAIENLPPAALRESLAWQSPLADFSEATLASVIDRFNSRSRIQLVLADEKLADRRIGGVFALDEAEAFVRLLERDGEIIGERIGETKILLHPTR